MNRTQAGLAVALALGLGVGAVLSAQPEYPPGQVAQVLTPEHVGVRDDGGLFYYRNVRATDGGYGIETLDAGQCARRAVGVPVNSCRRGTRDMGDLNRFPLALATGGTCERVACAVVRGDDPDITDAELHGRQRDAGRGPP